jgi:site-specific DNA recombinase
MKSQIPPVKSGAVIYCRVSTKEQADNFSLETQEKACKALCERERLTVLAIFSEAESAKSLDRAQFQAMQDYCIANRKQIAAVVVYNVSRFSRVTSDHLTVKLILNKLGITLRSVTEPLTADPIGRYTETIMSAHAQLDNELKALRTREGMAAAIASGKWVHRPPLGYVSSKLPGGLAPDASRADLIRRAFEMFASGAGSNAGILDTLTRLGCAA